MKNNYNDFPVHNVVKETISILEKKDWPKFQDDSDVEQFVKDIDSEITKAFGIFPSSIMFLKPSKFPFNIFRVRELDTINNINLLAEYSYPPAPFTKLGRCNFPKHPVFYGSNNPITAIAEVIRDEDYKNKKLCIASWGLINSDEDFVFENYLKSKLHPNNPFSAIAYSQLERLNEPFENQLNSEQVQGLSEFLKYIDSQFITDTNYSLSASLAHRSLYAKHNYRTDILMYPSVQTNALGNNFAISPNFVDTHMRVQRLYIIEVISYDKETGHFDLSFLQYAEIQKNVVLWKNLKEDDELYRTYFEEDFKAYLKPNQEIKFVKA